MNNGVKEHREERVLLLYYYMGIYNLPTPLSLNVQCIACICIYLQRRRVLSKVNTLPSVHILTSYCGPVPGQQNTR